MRIIFDKFNEEYGLLKKEKAIDAMNKIQKDFGPKIKESDLPKSIKKIKIPVITFYNKDNKEYDCAFYTSECAEERYEIVQEVSSLQEFFECVKYLKKERKYN
jgi:hypothetical protein